MRSRSDAKLSPDTASAAGGGTEANYTRSWITNCHIVEREPGDVYRLRLDRYTIVPTELAPTAYRDASRMRADTASAAGGGWPDVDGSRGAEEILAGLSAPVQPAPAAEGGEKKPWDGFERFRAELAADVSKDKGASIGKHYVEGVMYGVVSAMRRQEDAATARIRELEAERDRGRNILADTDIASLPKDHTLELTARARMNQLRAAEASLAALRAALGPIALQWKARGEPMLRFAGETITSILANPTQPTQDDDSPVPAPTPDMGKVEEALERAASYLDGRSHMPTYVVHVRVEIDAALSQLRSPNDG